MVDRRELLARSAVLAGLLAGVGLLPGPALAAWNAAAFEAKSLADVVKALSGAAPLESRDVTLTALDLVENGAAVPLTVGSTLPGLRRLLILVEKNPAPLAAVFELSDGVEASFGTRIKMSQSSNVYAVAMTAEGKVYFAQKEIKVTLGGCG